MRAAEVAVVGGGPAGLMAADRLSAAGLAVTIFDAMPSLGRKFLLAGRSGLNLTHAEPHETFVSRYGEAADALRPALDAFPGTAVRAFAEGLGVPTFVGSSGRVFPVAMKASPMLRAWLARLAERGARVAPRHRLTGIAEDGTLAFATPAGPRFVRPAATVLALGGASWPRLGSDGAWADWLAAPTAPVRPFRPANAGFDVGWSEPFATRFAGSPVKTVTARVGAGPATPGEFVVTGSGIEGSLVYAHSAALRDVLEAGSPASLVLDLVPGRSAERLARDLARVPGNASLSTRLKKGAGLEGVKAGLVRELVDPLSRSDPARLAAAIKALPIPVLRPRPIAEAISSAGGLAFEAVDDRFMLKGRPGVFVAGEMLDWEAPTGGYLITGCMATGLAAAEGVLAHLSSGEA